MSAWGQYGPCLVLCRLTVTTCCPWVSVGGVGTETNRNRLMTLWLCWFHHRNSQDSQAMSLATAKCLEINSKQANKQTSKQANTQTSKTNQSSSCTIVHTCLQVVYAPSWWDLVVSYPFTAQQLQVTVFKFYPSDPTYLIGGARLRSWKLQPRDDWELSTKASLFFQDFPRFSKIFQDLVIWSTDFPRFF